jgi:hypothetical protein
MRRLVKRFVAVFRREDEGVNQGSNGRGGE